MADRNLVFGVLALQLNFIDRDALTAAMQTWVHDKTRPLGDILEERKILPADRRVLLEALLREHLKLHGDDAGRSLAGLGLVEAVRKELEQITDRDGPADPAAVSISATRPPEGDSLATRAPSLGATGSDPGATLPTPATPFVSVASTGMRFRVLRPHARGGLGEVFVARDQELNREVALKEIQGRHADNQDSRSRFLLEAEITGGLEHPGIVPVYGLGAYADGRPYYAMRFIRGDSLKEAIDRFHKNKGAGLTDGQRALELRGLLGRFVDVCNAIHYAHNRGVLHRDLKPANVMLGKYGETLVVDWGLAKTLGEKEGQKGAEEPALQPLSGSGVTNTMQGSAMGTPQFMSPEQAAGRLDELGPATDVYSLGATLYSLLTGQAPFSGADVGELLHKVQKGDFPPPRQVRREVPPPLEAVCLKAMKLQPGDRYVSARALADDVEHWMADEPVSVYREPLTARLGRWARRHKTLVTCTAALLATAVVALTISTVLISNEQAKTQKQKELADQHSRMAEQSMDEFMKEAENKDLGEVPRMEEKRLALLMKGQEYYQHFLDMMGDDPSQREEAALANKRLGDILRVTEKTDEARNAYDKAIRMLTSLRTDKPDQPEYRIALGETYCNRGRVWRLESKREEARSDFEAALDLEKQLTADFPDRPEYRKELARTRNNLGILFKDLDRQADAEKQFSEAIDQFQKLREKDPDNADYRQQLARCYLNFGPVLRSTGRPDEAKTKYDEAIKIQTELEKSDPKMPDYPYELAVTYDNRGFLFANWGRTEEEHRNKEAEEDFRTALERFSKLAEQYPTVPVYRKQQANAQNNLAGLLAHTGKRPEAEVTWNKALEGFKKLAEDKPDEPQYQVSRWKIEGNLAWLLHDDDPAKAKPKLEEVIRNVQDLLDKHPHDAECLAILHDQSLYLADSLIALKEYDAAAKTAADLADKYRRNKDDYALAASRLCQCAQKDADHADGYAKTAVDLLRAGFGQGYKDAEELQKPAYKVLQSRDDFKQLLADMKAK